MVVTATHQEDDDEIEKNDKDEEDNEDDSQQDKKEVAKYITLNLDNEATEGTNCGV